MPEGDKIVQTALLESWVYTGSKELRKLFFRRGTI